MRKLKIYLDTSIISFVFADDAPEKQSITIEFFDKFIDKYDVYISRFVIAEIENTVNEKLKTKLLSVINKFDIKIIDIPQKDEDKIYKMAKKYIKEKIIPEKKIEDAIHISICVFYGFDVLLSWNFRHLANINKQILINAVNFKEGYLKEIFYLIQWR
jgi:predicted nucleic acid-binding protein